MTELSKRISKRYMGGELLSLTWMDAMHVAECEQETIVEHKDPTATDFHITFTFCRIPYFLCRMPSEGDAAGTAVGGGGGSAGFCRW